jgi:hypothetical protein
MRTTVYHGIYFHPSPSFLLFDPIRTLCITTVFKIFPFTESSVLLGMYAEEEYLEYKAGGAYTCKARGL